MKNVKNKETIKKQGKESKDNKISKICHIILICVLMSFLTIFGTISIFDKNPTESEREQRLLAQFPKFSLESFLNGQYFSQFDNAYNDTFPFRDFWLDAYSTLKNMVTININGTQLVDAENDEKDESEDQETEKRLEELLSMPFDYTGYEQYVNGKYVDGIAIEDKQAYYVFNGRTSSAKKFCDYIKNLQAQIPNNKVITFVIPDASAFYASDIYSKDNHEVKSWLEMLNKNLTGITAINPYDILQQHKDEYIYYRTDHHWTALGAYYGYQEICKQLKMYCYDIEDFQSGKISNFLGTFYSKTNSQILKSNPDEVYYYMPLVETKATAYPNLQEDGKSVLVVNPKTKSSSKYLCFMNGDHPLTVIETSADSKKSLVIIKDSYANALVPWLCNNYSTIYLIDPRKVNTTNDDTLKLVDFLKDKNDCEVMFCCVDYDVNNSSYLYFKGLLKLLK